MTDAEAPINGQDQRDRGDDESNGGSARPAVKFVLFADGTGNAFTTQESNVWRLYEALDRTKTDQVAFYIKGVGTAGWKPFAALVSKMQRLQSRRGRSHRGLLNWRKAGSVAGRTFSLRCGRPLHGPRLPTCRPGATN
jgi:uncharacterized protein (DUF2235 family)